MVAGRALSVSMGTPNAAGGTVPSFQAESPSPGFGEAKRGSHVSGRGVAL